MRKDQVEAVNVKIRKRKDELGSILRSHGYAIPDQKTFELLINALENMIILDNNGVNTFVISNPEGYIESVIDFDSSMVLRKDQDHPEDLLDGYYKIEDGKIIEDLDKKTQIFKPY